MISASVISSAALFAARTASFGSWSLADILIAIVVVAACCALVFIALRHFGIAIPPVVVQVIWICIVAFLVILALRFVLTL